MQTEIELKATKEWAAERFGISPDEVAWYHSGSCYDRIGVTTEAAADKVYEKVKHETVNGGFLDGMPLGGRTFSNGIYDVYC